MPTLLYENKEYKTDVEKALLFSNRLKGTFSESSEDSMLFDNKFKEKTGNYIKEKNIWRDLALKHHSQSHTQNLRGQ